MQGSNRRFPGNGIINRPRILLPREPYPLTGLAIVHSVKGGTESVTLEQREEWSHDKVDHY